MLQREYSAARALFAEVSATVARRGGSHLRCAAELSLLPCAAAAHDWTAFDEHLATSVALLAKTGLAETDTSKLTSLAGELAAAAGQEDRAVQAFEVALSNWQRLGRGPETEAVLRKLDALRRAQLQST